MEGKDYVCIFISGALTGFALIAYWAELFGT